MNIYSYIYILNPFYSLYICPILNKVRSLLKQAYFLINLIFIFRIFLKYISFILFCIGSLKKRQAKQLSLFLYKELQYRLFNQN